MLREMRLPNVYEHFMRPVVLLAASLALAIASTACTSGPAMDDGVISGVVQGAHAVLGLELLAKTDDLRLDGDIERCGRLIRDDESWAQEKRHRD